MHDLNVVIIEERVDRVNKQLILYSRKRTIRIQGDPAAKPVDYSHIKVTTINCKDDQDSGGYLIRIKAYRGGGGKASAGDGDGNKKKDLIKSSRSI